MTWLNKSIVSPILVGRAEEVALLETALATVRQGRGQVVLVAGEAGIGKSRLVGELCQRAQASGFTVLNGYCFEDDLVFPYAPLVDALRAFLALQPASAIATRLGLLAAELVKLLPELTLTIPTLQPTPALDPEAEKRRLFEALLQFFSQLTQGQPPAPLLLILEDLHWCDETSLDFLRLLARRITSYPILLVVSYRRDESTPALQQWVIQLERGRLAHEIHLRPLPEPAVETLLQAIFDLKRPVRAEFLAVLYRLTEGNPFFVEEVLKGLIASGDIFYADGQWDRKPIEVLHIPPTVQAAVQRRTAPVSAVARQVLTVAAVIGQRFDYALLQQVTGRADQELVALLKELVAAQLIVEGNSDHFAFRHALTRQAVYAELLGHERQVLHRAIGAAIEQLYADRLDTQATDLAYHFDAAGEWDKVLVYAQRAGEQAQALNTPRAAIEQFTRALQAAQQLRQTARLPDLYRARGLAYDLSGDFEQARSDLETVLNLAQTAADRQVEWQALLDLGQMWAGRDYAQTGSYFQQALTLARTLETPSALGHSLNRLGNWHLNVDEMPQAIGAHQEALTIFEQLTDQRGLAQTLDLLGMAYNANSDLVQSATYYQQAIALWHTLNERQGLASTLVTLSECGVYHETDLSIPASLSTAACIASCEQGLQIAREIGWRAGEAYALLLLGSSLVSLGQYGRGLAMLQRGYALAQEMEHNEWLCVALRLLGLMELDLLAFPTARRHLALALALAGKIGSVLHVGYTRPYLILLDIWQNEPSKAEEMLRSHLLPELPTQTMPERFLWWARAELALAQGHADFALQISDRLFMTAANAAGRPISAIPHLAYLRGRALTALQRWAEAEAIFQATLATAHVQETPRLLWRLQLALGQLYQAQGRTSEAAGAFTGARTVIDKIAATIPDIALRDNFLRQTQAMLPQPPVVTPPPAKATDARLTRREREVAALVAAGKSNRAIAETLVIGERTVEGHVGNLLSKLGFSSRAQLAVWAMENGLTKQ
jgi:DNA-binding CsgD family transcriptional regulator